MANAVETVEVIVRDPRTHEPISTLEIPAYTRSTSKFEARLNEVTDEYLRRSAFSGDSVSLGDFALFLLSKASEEPFEQ